MNKKERKEEEDSQHSSDNSRSSKDKNFSMREAGKVEEEGINQTYTPINLNYATGHLKHFEDLKKATRLSGKYLTIVLKALWYGLLSCIMPKLKLRLGNVITDGRIHLLIPLKSGGGKNELNRVIKSVLKKLELSCEEPTTLHPEQLIGKVIKRYIRNEPHYEYIYGYFDLDYLIIDEGRTLLTSDNLIYVESRKQLRNALNPFPDNDITKKSVDIPLEKELKYKPYNGTCIFVQPYPFSEDFATDGDLRRFIVPFLPKKITDKSKAYTDRVMGVDGNEELHNFTDYLKEIRTFFLKNGSIGVDDAGNPAYTKEDCFTLEDGVKTYFDELSQLLIKHGINNTSYKVQNFADMTDFTLQNLLLKLCTIQAIQNKSTTITKDNVSLAFVDLVEFTTHLYLFIDSKIIGSMNYGELPDKISGKDGEALDWLIEEEAVSYDSSNVSIQNYEDKIMEIYNVGERQAIRIKQKHVDNGWIKSKKGHGVSSVWLISDIKSGQEVQNLHDIDEIDDMSLQDKYDEIIQDFMSGKSGKSSINSTEYFNGYVGDAPEGEVHQSHNEDDNENRSNYDLMDDEALCNKAYIGGDESAMEKYEARLLAAQNRQEKKRSD